jgi:hypothetical protein
VGWRHGRKKEQAPAEWARSGLDRRRFGVSARVFSDNEVRQLLRAAVERAGSQVAFAKRHGIDRAHLNQVLKGKSQVRGSLLKCLGLRKSYTIDQAAKPGRRTEARSLAPALEHVEV